MPFEVQQMDDQHLVDLASRLERAERRAKNLQRLLELGQGLTTEATKGEWSRRVAGEVLRAARCRWSHTRRCRGRDPSRRVHRGDG